ncbi:hypothetical protein ACJJTC_012604 [Scirpophaga incertulas]
MSSCKHEATVPMISTRQSALSGHYVLTARGSALSRLAKGRAASLPTVIVLEIPSARLLWSAAMDGSGGGKDLVPLIAAHPPWCGPHVSWTALHNALVVPADAPGPYRRARGACATRTFTAVALPDEAP